MAALVAWGDEEAIARRVREQLDAGAGRVLITPVDTDLYRRGAPAPARPAPVLTGVVA